jgi:hypothetical protein
MLIVNENLLKVPGMGLLIFLSKYHKKGGGGESKSIKGVDRCRVTPNFPILYPPFLLQTLT